MDAQTTQTMLRCTACGARVTASCNCGVDYAPISKAESIKRRQQKIIDLYQAGLTQQQIADQLKVSQSTVRDALNLVETTKLKHAKTTTNPKGAGRPKIGTRAVRRNKAHEAIAALEALGKAITEDAVVQRSGVSKGTSGAAIAAHFAAKEAAAEAQQIAAENHAIAISLTDKGKIKLEDAIRIHKARLDKLFEQRVNEKVRQQIEAAADATRAENKRLRQENLSLTMLLSKRSLMTVTEFMLVLSCLHPDSRTAVSEEKLKQAFQVMQPKKYAFTGEK